MKKFYLSLFFSTLVGFFTFAQGGFVKVVDAANPITTYSSSGIYKGVSWVDIDNDNDIDLFATPNFLFRNENGTFVQIQNPFNFTPQQNPGGASFADINHDGFVDCAIAQYPSGVYLGNGDGTFINTTSQYPSLNNYPSWGCAIGNWNNDAYTDFIFAHAAGFHSVGPFPSNLYLNTSAISTPQLITGYAITDTTNPYTVPYWSDYDLDGDMDLFIASGPGGSPGPDFCYKNMKIENGSNTLELMTNELFASELQDGQCYNFIDFDNDGDFDLCLTNYAGAPTKLYINTAGNYTSLATPFTTQTTNLANNWGDFDNDGDLDVIISNDNEKPKLYKNNNGTFDNAIELGTVANSSGVAHGDYDNDGDLDVFVSGLNTARAFYKNDTLASGNNWISIQCTGTVSNTSALGTIVKIRATINGVDTWQMREINAQNSFQSQNDLRVHFGLGNASIIQTLIIKYPSGIIETFSNVNTNTFYFNQENSGNLLSVNRTNTTHNSIVLHPNPSKEWLHVEFDTKSENQTVKISVIDQTGKINHNSSQKIKDNIVKIDISMLALGVYYLKIENEYSSNYSKFIKE